MRQHIGYWDSITQATHSLWSGLKITLNHIWKARHSKKPIAVQHPDYFHQPDGIVTIQYPHDLLPVPDTGRYRLHNEIDDCIVCDKCVKVCPVDCITIEPIRATEEFGKTSDGTPRRIYAARFDIDMSKCCFCGLCTTVCPTECLTMTKTYDFSVFDIREHNYGFAEMTPEQITEKKKLFEEYQKTKATASAPHSLSQEPTKPSRPVFKPKIKPPGS